MIKYKKALRISSLYHATVYLKILINAKNNNPLYASAAHRHDEATIAYFSDRKLLSCQYKTFGK